MPYRRRFSDDEFQKKVFEIATQEHPDYSMLCNIASKQLWSYIKRKCAGYASSRRRNVEEDAMQEIHCRLIKTCV